MPIVDFLSTREHMDELARSRGRLGIPSLGAVEEAANELWRSSSTNPAGPRVDAVIRECGDIVAAASYTPKIFSRSGDQVLVAEIGGTFTAPDAQGKGYFSSLVSSLIEHAENNGIQSLYGTPNEQSGALYIKKLGWAEVGHWMRWLRPQLPIARHMTDVTANLRARPPRGVRPAFEIGWTPLAVDDLLDGGRVRSDHVVRSPEWFRWRFPEARYSMVRCLVEGQVVSWCVSGPTVRLGRRGAAIADFAITPGAEWTAARLFERAGHSVPRSRFLFGMTLGESHSAVWRTIGAIGRPSPMPLIAHAGADPLGDRYFHSMVFDAGDSDTV